MFFTINKACLFFPFFFFVDPDSDNNVEVNEISNQLNSVNFNYKSRPDDIMEQDYSDKEAAFRLLKTSK